MKKIVALILTFFLSASPAFAAFGQYRSITIDPAKVGGLVATPVNFPVLVNGVYSYLATVVNGGKVTNANGYDVGFYTGADCATGKMNWESVLYTATTGIVEYWVKSATLSTTTSTVFYMCYGDSTISTDQSSGTSVWDANYLGVWHLPNGTTLTALDSTSNGKNGTITTPTVTAGKIDGGANFSASSANIITTAMNTALVNFTAEAWFKSSADTASKRIVDKKYDTGFWMGHDTAGTANKWGGGVLEAGPPYGIFVTLANNSWHHIASIRSGTTHTIIGDGGAVTTSNTVSGSAIDTANLSLGNETTGSPANALVGQLDEVRISNIARSADWITTDYNTVATSTFYTVGAETSVTSPISRFTLWAQMTINSFLFIN